MATRDRKGTQKQTGRQIDRRTEYAPWEEWWPTKGQPGPKRRERGRGQGRRHSSKLNVLNRDSEIQFSCQSFLLATILNTFHTHTHTQTQFYWVWADEIEEREREREREREKKKRGGEEGWALQITGQENINTRSNSGWGYSGCVGGWIQQLSNQKKQGGKYFCPL